MIVRHGNSATRAIAGLELALRIGRETVSYGANGHAQRVESVLD